MPKQFLLLKPQAFNMGKLVYRVNFKTGAASDKADYIEEVANLTAAAGEIFDLQTGMHTGTPEGVMTNKRHGNHVMELCLVACRLSVQHLHAFAVLFSRAGTPAAAFGGSISRCTAEEAAKSPYGGHEHHLPADRSPAQVHGWPSTTVRGSLKHAYAYSSSLHAMILRSTREQARLARHATASGAAEDGCGQPSATPRRGVLPGSFLDIMMQATDKTTGNCFSDFEIANQACPSCRVGCIALPVTCVKVLAQSLKRVSFCVLQAYAMMMAGYESTANALAFTLYLLALNKDKEARLIAEVDAFGSMDMPCYADMARHADALAAGPPELAHNNTTPQPSSLREGRQYGRHFQLPVRRISNVATV